MTKKGIVYLVGAGPGDPGLITRRGADVLASADVVLYDRLVDPSVLDLAPDARLVDVGKRPGEAGESQGNINDLLVREANDGMVVVRLKGGDPFVFGRGGEECEALAAAGVRFEVVPGVTSATAAPAYAGIPLTHRAHASWVAIATGTERDGPGARLDWDALAKAHTAIFLMGVERLGDIASSLIAAGREPATPAAVIASATLPGQRVVRSTLGTIAHSAEREGIEPPAVLVVGDVASPAAQLDWLAGRPLAGRRVFVTRTRGQEGKLGRALRELGAEPLEFPAIRIDPVDPAGVDAALGRLGDFAWVVFTSVNTIDAIERRLDALGLDARAFATSKVAAVGGATAERLRDLGIRADLVPTDFTSAAVAEAFPRGPGLLLLPRAAGAPGDLPDLLRDKGWDVEVAAAYRTVTDQRSVDAGRDALRLGVDAVCFTSGSTVRSFVELWGSPPSKALVCCIGPVTAGVAEELGLHVDAIAAEHTVEGLVAALVDAVRG